MPSKEQNIKSAGNIDGRIGLKISQLRIAKGMTRQLLAEQLGITHQQLQKYEKGVNRIAASRLVEIASALSSPVSYFFEGIHDENTDKAIERQRLCVEVMHDFVNIQRPEQQEAVRTLLRSLSKR